MNITNITFDDVRPEVKKFAVEMEEKLRANDFKTHWSECDYEYLVERYIDAINDTNKVIFYAHNMITPYGDQFMKTNVLMSYHVTDGLVNIANYAMMLHDKISVQRCDYMKALRGKMESEEKMKLIIDTDCNWK